MNNDFEQERERLNELVLGEGSLNTKRFFNLDHKCYEDGALPALTKETLGLCASLVLRCDDCISYHVIQCRRSGLEDDQFKEACDVALVVGGSIVIPHLRRAYDLWFNKLSGTD